MPIEKHARHINTEHRRLKKMTPKLWKELTSLEELTTLYFSQIEGVDDYLGRLSELSKLKNIGLLYIQVGEKIAELSLPDSCTNLYVSRIECEHLSSWPMLENIKTADIKQDDEDVAKILQVLPNLRELEIGDTYSTEGLYILFESIKELGALTKLKISRDSLTSDIVKYYCNFGKEKSVEIEWVTDEDSQILIDKWK